MTKSAVGDWSTTAGSNTTIDGNNVAENCAMSGINNAIRGEAAAIVGQLTFLATADTADAYTASPVPTPDALATDVLYCVTFGTANTTTTPTLALATIAAEGAKPIVSVDNSALLAGQLHGRHLLAYDGTSYRCLNPIALLVATRFIGGTSTGSGNAQVLATVTPAGFVLTAGNSVTFIAGFSNTGATTLNVSSTGVTNVFKATAAGPAGLASGDIIAANTYDVIFDGTQYELSNPTPVLMKSKIIIITRNASAVDGSVSYTGVGFTPTALSLNWSIAGASSFGAGVGYVDSTKQGRANSYDQNAVVVTNNAIDIWTPDDGNTKYDSGVVTSFDADGFTIAWTKTSTPASVSVPISVLCLR